MVAAQEESCSWRDQFGCPEVAVFCWLVENFHFYQGRCLKQRGQEAEWGRTVEGAEASGPRRLSRDRLSRKQRGRR